MESGGSGAFSRSSPPARIIDDDGGAAFAKAAHERFGQGGITEDVLPGRLPEICCAVDASGEIKTSEPPIFAVCAPSCRIRCCA